MGLYGTGSPHEKLSKEIVVTEPGFVYIYFSNDNPEPMDVVFDDFEVEQVRSAIVQADDYYPGGLTFNLYKRSYSAAQDYLYQGKELQPELTTYDFHARMNDPAIVRTFQTDPMSEMFYDHSP